MAVYSVYQPPLKRYETSTDPERFAFVRDGFHFWAFVLAPLWMLWHRMWLTFIGYVAVVVGAEVLLHWLGAPASVNAAVGLLLALLVGFEAGTLRRFTLGRRGWGNVAVVVGNNRETAERRFYETWLDGAAAVSAPPSAPSLRRSPNANDVIGLFPEQSAPR